MKSNPDLSFNCATVSFEKKLMHQSNLFGTKGLVIVYFKISMHILLLHKYT